MKKKGNNEPSEIEVLCRDSIDPLTRREERELLIAYRNNGDREALETLTRANLRYVAKESKKYVDDLHPIGDVFSAGCNGLLIAIDRFDLDSPVKLITYAVWWIRQQIQQNICGSHVVRQPASRSIWKGKMRRTKKELQQVNKERYINDYEAILTMQPEIDEDQFDARCHWLAATKAPVSLDSFPNVESQDVYCFHIGAYQEGDAENNLMQEHQAQLTQEIFNLLTDRERMIVACYFGFVDDQRYTLEQIGTMMGITRERVRQIKVRAIKKVNGHLIHRLHVMLDARTN